MQDTEANKILDEREATVKPIKISKTDGEILAGILYDMQNKKQYKTIVKNILVYLLKKNKLTEIGSGNLLIEIDENDKIKFKKYDIAAAVKNERG